jgi:hypothetical protein
VPSVNAANFGSRRVATSLHGDRDPPSHVRAAGSMWAGGLRQRIVTFGLETLEVRMAPSSPNAIKATSSPLSADPRQTGDGSVQVHLRLPTPDANLKQCADERGQTLSAFVRFLLRRYCERERRK